MFRFGRTLALRVALGMAVLCSALAGGSLVPQHAFAQWGICYDDPVVVISNLSAMDLSTTINDNSSDVHEVLFVLHGPVGTRAVGINPTLGIMGPKEKFVYDADQPASTYVSDTYVYTGTAGISVSAHMLVTSLPTLGAMSAAGYSGQDLHIKMQGLLSGIL